MSPEAGLATAAKLKPHRALEALGGVSQAVDQTVGDEHKTLQSAPPTMERPAGAPQTLRGKPATSAPGQYSGDPAAKVDAPEEKKAKVEGDKTPEGEIPGADIPEPSPVDLGLAAGAKFVAGAVNTVGGWFGADGDIIDTDALVGKIMGMPTEDEMLKNATVGTPDGVDLQGETGGRAGEQDGELDSKGRQLHSSGREDSERPLGEDQIYPDVPREKLTAKVPGGKGGGGGTGPGAGTGAIPPEAVSAVAEHERGPQLQSAFADGRQDISAKRRTKDEDFRSSRDDHRRKVRTEIDTNSRTQADERRKTKTEVAESRARWREEQDGELDGLGTKKSARLTKIRQDVKDKEEKTDKDVGERQDKDEKEIGKKQEKAEDDAEKKRDDAKNDSGNWISKAFDWIREQFVKLRDAIVGFFRAARDAVRNLIKDFKGTVLRWIEEARKWIVEKFREFVDALIELGKALLTALIEIATRIRDLIIRIRDAAIALVNELARKLRQMVTDLLNALGRLLNGILEALRKGLETAVKAVMTAVKGIMDFALGLLNALGEWAMIAADIITDPGGWLSNAKASAEDGAKNHLFREVTSAIKEWFNAKIQEILGLPTAIFQALLNGGITVQQMVKEAWEAALPQLPIIIGEIVVTKVIAKLIPGAGWVLAIIDALKAAWGALSEILNALGAFMNFLKAVKGGGAGLLFAKAVASGVVALLELAYEFLLSGIGKYVSKVGDKFKGIAANLKKGPKGEKPGGKDQTGPKDQDRPREPATTAAPRPAGADRPAGTDRPATGDRPTGTDRDRPSGTDRDRPARPGDRRPTPDRNRPAGTTRPTAPGRPPARPGQDRPARPTRPAPPRTARAATPPAAPGHPDPPARPGPDRPGDRRPDNTRPDSRRPDDRDRDRDRRPDDRTPDSRRPDRDRDTDRTRDRDRPRRPASDRRDDRDRRQEERRKQRDDRRKKESSEESKQDRLKRIVARIRPKLDGILGRGVPQPVLRGALATMRAWYRLTGLEISSDAEQFGFTASLNPSLKFGEAYWDKFSRVAADGIRRFTENADRTRQFSESEQNVNAERYGEAELGHHMRDLPRDQRRAALEYSEYGWVYNEILRAVDDPEELLESWRDPVMYPGPRVTLQRILGTTGTGRHGRYTPEDIAAALSRPGLVDVDEGKLRGILDVGSPGDTPEQVRSKQLRTIARWMKKYASPRERLTLSFGGTYPTPEDFLERNVLIDEATRSHRLPEGLEVHRSLRNVNFMEGYSPLGLDRLIGTTQREPGFMSTSVGGESTFASQPFRLRINVPEGSPALWLGRTSKYPHQRELLLPSNTEYRILDVIPHGRNGPWTIIAEVVSPMP
ncbi:ADP-ribosyltransferase [Streptomyces sp. MNU89]|uniref:ADP-ribosyltransferase n=1 Tax=Streptomyces sp. MNU89 TaxID=2560025 RepID=UPI0027E1F8AA|nr:ADP-ribosyltransferase [Streptomyces sp. MNU89]